MRRQEQKITCITTCKGRLSHLRQSLPRMIQSGFEKVIVVDYGCPDGAASWVRDNYPQVTVCRADDDTSFHAARARNLGAAFAETEWLFFFDADTLVQPGLADWCRQLQNIAIYRPGKLEDGSRDKETWGSFICTNSAFRHVEGYDEVFRGWGGEDTDIYEKLRSAGLIELTFPAKFLRPIRHNHEERTRFYDLKDKNLSHAIHWLYMTAKKQVALTSQIPYSRINKDVRQELWGRIAEQARAWDLAGRPGSLSIRVTLKAQSSLYANMPTRIGCTLELDISEPV